MKLDIYTVRVLLINAILCNAYQTEEGKKLVADYVRVHTTSSDTEGLLSLMDTL